MKNTQELDAIRKHLENLHIFSRKNEKIKRQAEEIESFYRALHVETVTEFVDMLRSRDKELNTLSEAVIKSINDQHEAHERQMSVAESEIKRLNIIIDYLRGELREL